MGKKIGIEKGLRMVYNLFYLHYFAQSVIFTEIFKETKL